LDEALGVRLDQLLDRVTTLSPNHLQDWWEIQTDVLEVIRDEGYAVQIDEVVERFREWAWTGPISQSFVVAFDAPSEHHRRTPALGDCPATPLNRSSNKRVNLTRSQLPHTGSVRLASCANDFRWMGDS
jgi:hypothetical protein